ncbi:hypothetical protein SAMN06265348_110279 [Pedobacter westerhofensis]|uniref:Uncharacterized protein n=1 Tax=Pedobacter westerhofensis TaxID=425512 RepID=A0A521F7Y1_9SPHI|nr:hypothetical protein [Pedobacter westerhofensis]SMO92315.1 hypothetical protein SAMN06265348_110279 [Pedobacter westerhofensis]
MAYISMTPEELRKQHSILGILKAQNDLLHTYNDPTTEERASGLGTITRVPFRYKTTEDIAPEINVTEKVATVLISNLKALGLVGIDYRANTCNIIDAGYLAYFEERLLREADSLKEAARKDRRDKLVSISNLLVALLTLIMTIVGIYYVQIAPLQKERDNLTNRVNVLKAENSKLNQALKQVNK